MRTSRGVPTPRSAHKANRRRERKAKAPIVAFNSIATPLDLDIHDSPDEEEA
jgi:hypothetical protein